MDETSRIREAVEQAIEKAVEEAVGKAVEEAVGKAVGKAVEETALNRNVEIAKKLIKRGMTNEEIAEDTGLSIAQIEALRHEEA